jgi:hypothetical protein
LKIKTEKKMIGIIAVLAIETVVELSAVNTFVREFTISELGGTPYIGQALCRTA